MKIDATSYCVVFTGATPNGDFFLPIMINGEDGMMVHNTLHGDFANPYAMGASVLLSAMEQVDIGSVFIDIGYDRRKAIYTAHMISYYNSEVGKKVYRLEIPLLYGLIMPILTGEQLQIVTGNDVVALMGRNMSELELFINRSE
jgi:hypothetical protein